MNREEILKEIDEAMSELRDVKAKVNEALSHARNIILNAGNREEAYNKGLEDAWELARKIADKKGNDREKIFKVIFTLDVLKSYTPQEALAKLEAYEKAQEEIKVGDVVICTKTSETAVVVRKPTDKEIYILWGDGSAGRHMIENFVKTGKHIDISSILEQIGGGDNE